MDQNRNPTSLEIKPTMLGAGANAPMVQTQEQQPVVMYDTSNPRSLINLVPEKVREKINEALFEEQALFEMDEGELYKHLKSLSSPITPTDNRLRVKFWMEYDHCQSKAEGQIDIMRVIAGICTYEYFHRRFLKTPKKVAWLLCPPTSYQLKANEALEYGLEQLRDLLSIPHLNAMGKVDVKLGELKLKIIQMLDIRVKGAPVQRVINANLSGKDAAQAVHQAATANSMESLQRQLAYLQQQEKELQNGQTVLITAQTQQKK